MQQKTHLIEDIQNIQRTFKTKKKQETSNKNKTKPNPHTPQLKTKTIQNRSSLDTSIRKTYRWQTSLRKDGQHSLLIGNCKLKQDIITHLLEWSEFKTLTILKAGEGVKQQEF